VFRWRKKEQELRERTELLELKKRYMFLELEEAGEAEAQLSRVMGGDLKIM